MAEPNQPGTPVDDIVYGTPDPQTGRQPDYYAAEQPVHAAPEQPETEPETELESEPPRRRGRSTGETYRKKNKDPANRKIEFGPDGNKAGSATGAFGNTLGRIARDHVPINYEDWKKVPINIKSNCWDKIKVKQLYLIIFILLVYLIVCSYLYLGII